MVLLLIGIVNVLSGDGLDIPTHKMRLFQEDGHSVQLLGAHSLQYFSPSRTLYLLFHCVILSLHLRTLLLTSP